MTPARRQNIVKEGKYIDEPQHDIVMEMLSVYINERREEGSDIILNVDSSLIVSTMANAHQVSLKHASCANAIKERQRPRHHQIIDIELVKTPRGLDVGGNGR